jgi:sulfur carrier protein
LAGRSYKRRETTERLPTLKRTAAQSTSMNVVCEVVGESEETVSLDDDATYADLCRAVGYSPHEVTVLVDGTPVPEDGVVTEEFVKVLRLVKGG